MWYPQDLFSLCWYGFQQERRVMWMVLHGISLPCLLWALVLLHTSVPDVTASSACHVSTAPMHPCFWYSSPPQCLPVSTLVYSKWEEGCRTQMDSQIIIEIRNLPNRRYPPLNRSSTCLQATKTLTKPQIPEFPLQNSWNPDIQQLKA